MSVVIDALRWALAELRGETSYENESQRQACFDRADDALAPHSAGIANGDEPKTLRAKDSSQ